MTDSRIELRAASTADLDFVLATEADAREGGFVGGVRHLYTSDGFVEEDVLRECFRREDAPSTYASLVVMSMLEPEHRALMPRSPDPAPPASPAGT